MGLIDTKTTVILLTKLTNIQLREVFRLGSDFNIQPLSLGEWTQNKKNAQVLTGINPTTDELEDIRLILEANNDEPEFYMLNEIDVKEILPIRKFIEQHRDEIKKSIIENDKKNGYDLPDDIVMSDYQLGSFVRYDQKLGWGESAIQFGTRVSEYVYKKYGPQTLFDRIIL